MLSTFVFFDLGVGLVDGLLRSLLVVMVISLQGGHRGHLTPMTPLDPPLDIKL